MSTLPHILATAGHVDHGKSALIKALTGTDPDRLPEEKARGITIDLGFANLLLPTPAGDTLQLGIVDVPGHEDFVRNMVAGVGSIDAALLVVAADDGWMPQTEEHLQILTYLGATRGVVALTKIDLAGDEAAAIAGVREALRNSPLAEAPIVPTSVVTGRGIDELKSALTTVFAGVRPQRDIGKPRLAVDRVFTLKGVGTIVTGTLTGGSLRRGQAVIVQPSGVPAKIRSVQTHNQDLAIAPPGSRVALNLPEISAATIRRGDVVTLPRFEGPRQTLLVRLEQSPRVSAKPIKQGLRVHLHHGTADTPARVFQNKGVRPLCF